MKFFAPLLKGSIVCSVLILASVAIMQAQMIQVKPDGTDDHGNHHFMELGIALKEEKSTVKITFMIPEYTAEILQSNKVSIGDIIESLNSKPVSSVAEFKKIYGAIAVKHEMNLKIKHPNGQRYAVIIKKPEAKEQLIIAK